MAEAYSASLQNFMTGPHLQSPAQVFDDPQYLIYNESMM